MELNLSSILLFRYGRAHPFGGMRLPGELRLPGLRATVGFFGWAAGRAGTTRPGQPFRMPFPQDEKNAPNAQSLNATCASLNRKPWGMRPGWVSGMAEQLCGSTFAHRPEREPNGRPAPHFSTRNYVCACESGVSTDRPCLHGRPSRRSPRSRRTSAHSAFSFSALARPGDRQGCAVAHVPARNELPASGLQQPASGTRKSFGMRRYKKRARNSFRMHRYKFIRLKVL